MYTLPRELRDRTYEFVLREHLVHFRYLSYKHKYLKTNELPYRSNYDCAWRLVVCGQDCPENEQEVMSNTKSRTDPMDLTTTLPMVKYPSHQYVHLGLLRFCRRLYVQTNQTM